jgi:RND superfamily putative drug exporter
LLELPTEFLDARNMPLIKRVQELIDVKGAMQSEGIVPRGLDMALSGSATVGRDMMQAAKESSRDTEKWTVILVVLLLIGIYRAPLMAIIPLITVGVATEISLALLALLAKGGYVNIFSGIEVYVKVLSYGAGVDYCLFLIARYKEELDEGSTLDGAVSNSLAKVGHALVASAGTVICGIFMMYFAEFGKFSQAGIAITLGLIVVLAASLTFSPALLRLARRWAFWPRIAGQNLPRTAGWVSATSLWSRVFDRNLVQLAWNHVSDLVRIRPGTVLLGCFLVMLPFACIGVHFHGFLSYGLLAELPRNTASVIGSEAVALHFPPGIGGPMTVLIRDKNGSFLNEEEVALSDQAKELVHSLTDSLRKNSERLQLSDVRSVLQPYGGTTAVADDESARQENSSAIVQTGGIKGFLHGAKNRVTQDRTLKHYVSSVGDLKGKILRLDLVLQEDPFARNSIAQFESIRQSVQAAVPTGFEVFAIGPTASIRDLKNVTDRDQIRIDVLVLGGVFLILIVLLRRVMISLYLIISVFFSYLVTLGVTFAAFYLLDPSNFVGLDWKVPMFLFTILIAVGEDYNIFLMTRIDEEQALHGPTAGVISALRKTGSIISSCGIIMAGTFCSLMAGSLAGLHQLGFALAFGVLLDTFVVRPILVPAFLVLLHEGRLRSWQCLLDRADR